LSPSLVTAIPSILSTSNGAESDAITSAESTLLRPVLSGLSSDTFAVKPDGKPMADSFVTEVTQNTWIFLPWEDQEFPPHIHAQIGTHLD
jgi:hypothetical protein